MKRVIIALDYQELYLLDLALDYLAIEEISYLNEAEEGLNEEDSAKACATLDAIDELQDKIRRKKDKYENHD